MGQYREPDLNDSGSPAEPSQEHSQAAQKLVAPQSSAFPVLQIITFAFGIIISGLAVALPALGLLRNSDDSFVLFPTLAVGFALILTSLGLSARSDRRADAGVARNRPEQQNQLPDRAQKLRRQSKPEENLDLALASVRRRITEHINRLTRFALGNIVIGSIVAGAG